MVCLSLNILRLDDALNRAARYALLRIEVTFAFDA
jgi:hypothetical protein